MQTMSVSVHRGRLAIGTVCVCVWLRTDNRKLDLELNLIECLVLKVISSQQIRAWHELWRMSDFSLKKSSTQSLSSNLAKTKLSIDWAIGEQLPWGWLVSIAFERPCLLACCGPSSIAKSNLACIYVVSERGKHAPGRPLRHFKRPFERLCGTQTIRWITSRTGDLQPYGLDLTWLDNFQPSRLNRIRNMSRIHFSTPASIKPLSQPLKQLVMTTGQ